MRRLQRAAQATALIAAIVPSLATSALAEDCPALAGRMPGRITAVAVSGDHAYLGTADGLVVADVSQPEVPRLVGEVRAGGGWPFSVAVSGAYAYVASSGSLDVIDISRPAAPVLVAHLNLAWYVSSVAVSGNHAFVTGGGEWPSDGDLFVIDVTVPWAPVVVGSARLPVPGSSVTVSGTHAYVADWDGGLRVIDVSVPSAPVEVSAYVDGAVADYERRQSNLQQLVQEATGVLQELKRQAAEHRRAAAEAQQPQVGVAASPPRPGVVRLQVNGCTRLDVKCLDFPAPAPAPPVPADSPRPLGVAGEGQLGGTRSASSPVVVANCCSWSRRNCRSSAYSKRVLSDMRQIMASVID